MKLSDRLEAEASLSSVVEMGSGYTISVDRHDEQTQALLREAAALAKRYEDAPVGSLTVEGEHWVFYNGGEAGSVNRVLDKTIRLVEVLP